MITPIPITQIDTIEPLWWTLRNMHQELDAACNMPIRTIVWEERKAEFIEKAQTNALLEVAMQEGQMAGYCFSSIDVYGQGEVDSLYVEPQYREHGLGSKLLLSAKDWFANNSCEAIKIWVHPGNFRGIRFYWKHGFLNEPVMHNKLASPQ